MFTPKKNPRTVNQNEDFQCPGQDLNLHSQGPLPPQSSVSTNFTTWAEYFNADEGLGAQSYIINLTDQEFFSSNEA